MTSDSAPLPIEPVKRRVGRPKDHVKRAAILEAACQHFLQHGYGGASMDTIAAEAGVSKLTIYSHFENKDTLFQEVIHTVGDRQTLVRCPQELAGMTPEQALREVARDMLNLWLHPDILNLHRIMVVQSAQQPKSNRLMIEAGPEKTKRQLAELLGRIEHEGVYRFPDTYKAAVHFRALLRSDIYTHCLLRLRSRPDAAEVEAHVEDVVALFLKAHCA